MLKDIGGDHQGTGESIHTTDMSDEDILQVRRITAGLGVEVRTSGSQATSLKDDQPSLCQLIDIHRELIRIPTILVIATVRVNTAQHAGIGGGLQLMLECMSGQGSVVYLDIQGEILVQSIMAKETDHGLRIHVILMFRRFHRFRLDQERTLETVLTAIITGHRQHHG